jgi:hypothetical protein
MASGTKSATFNYYKSGKYGTLPQNPQKDMEVTQDMHLKMSKKIAQLTKVNYFVGLFVIFSSFLDSQLTEQLPPVLSI